MMKYVDLYTLELTLFNRMGDLLKDAVVCSFSPLLPLGPCPDVPAG